MIMFRIVLFFNLISILGSAFSQTDGQVLTRVDGGASWSDPTGSNIYSQDGSINEHRTVTLGTDTVSFISNAINGFNIDGATFSVDGDHHRLGVGTTDPTSGIHINTSIAYPMRLFIASDPSISTTTLGDDDYILRVNAQMVDANITLPDPTSCRGRVYEIYKTNNTNSMIFSRPISGQNTWTARVYIKIISDGTRWILLEEH